VLSDLPETIKKNNKTAIEIVEIKVLFLKLFVFFKSKIIKANKMEYDSRIYASRVSFIIR
jgi:hypothetical protein